MVDHFSECHSEGGPLGECIILTGEKRNGLASILSWKCTGCDQEMSFSTSTKVAGTKGNQYGPVILQQCGVRWSQVVDLIH